MLSGRGLCDGPIPRLEESYRVCWVTMCDLETSRMRRPWPALGCFTRGEKDVARRDYFGDLGTNGRINLTSMFEK